MTHGEVASGVTRGEWGLGGGGERGACVEWRGEGLSPAPVTSSSAQRGVGREFEVESRARAARAEDSKNLASFFNKQGRQKNTIPLKRVP